VQRTYLAALVVLLVCGLEGFGQVQTPSLTYVPGSGDCLPCYVYDQWPLGEAHTPPGSTFINLGAPAGGGLYARTVEVPQAERYREFHGWDVRRCADAGLILDNMNAAEMCAFVQAHGHVELWVDGQEIPAIYLTLPQAVDASDGAGYWLLLWVFEYPEGLIFPAIYSVTLVHSWDLPSMPCSSGPDDAPLSSVSRTATVTVLYQN
jgi:hypothetical protein